MKKYFWDTDGDGCIRYYAKDRDTTDTFCIFLLRDPSVTINYDDIEPCDERGRGVYPSGLSFSHRIGAWRLREPKLWDKRYAIFYDNEQFFLPVIFSSLDKKKMEQYIRKFRSAKKQYKSFLASKEIDETAS